MSVRPRFTLRLRALARASVSVSRARAPASTHLVLAAGSLVWIGCTDPSYSEPDSARAPQDAGASPVSARSDAGVLVPADVGVAALPEAGTNTGDAGSALVPDAGPLPPEPKVLPTWAQPLLGRYATRAFTFAQDDFPTVTRSQDVYLAEFTLDAATGRVTLRSKLCQSVAQNTLGSTLRLVDATHVPERVEQVVLNELEPRFSTDGPPGTVGYTKEPPSMCTDKLNQSVPKAPVQTWIAGDTCRCLRAEAAPLLNDCRVLDPDGDNKPGFTFLLHAPPLGDAQIYAASESATHYVNGQISADGKRLDANVLPGERPFQLDCAPSGCRDIAKLATYCPTSFNPARFVRVDATATCQTIVGDLPTLFPEPPPPLVDRCF